MPSIDQIEPGQEAKASLDGLRSGPNRKPLLSIFLVDISMRAITAYDFVHLKRWQSLSHVMEVWGNSKHEEPYEQYVYRTADGSVHQFIIESGALPVGYFQFYGASKVGDGW